MEVGLRRLPCAKNAKNERMNQMDHCDKRMSILRWTAAIVLLGMAVCSCATRINDTMAVRRVNGTLCQPWDLRMRHNELLCIHRGINPFRIWNREVKDAHFHGLARPEFEGPNCFTVMDFDNSVHAYPPWHAVFFWWYGWLPYGYVVAIFFLLAGFALESVFRVFERLQPDSLSARAVFWSFLIFLYSMPIVACVESGNYGLLIAGLTVLFLAAEEKNRPVLSGVIWAVMMIKPQLVMLLFWPLLFQRRYVTIGVAIVTCLMATLVSAAFLHESPVDLIHQTYLLGIPYVETPIWWKPIDSLLGSYSNLVRMGFFFGLCGWIAWWMRAVKPFVMRYVAPFILLPVWFYCQDYDLLASWPAAYLILYWFHNRRQKWHGWIFFCWLSCAMFKTVWVMTRQYLGFNPAGLGWIYWLVESMSALVCVWAFFLAIRSLKCGENVNPMRYT